MEVDLNGQKKILNQIKYLDAVEIEELRRSQGLRVATKKFLIHSGLTDEEVENLSLEDGLRIQKILNELTTSFQIPTEDKE